MTTRQTQYDYGVLNDVSRGLNQLLGDRTGRTVTQRTQDGFANLTNGNITPSGVVVHGLMGFGVGLATSRNKTVHYIGLFLVGLIVLAWIMGAVIRH